MVEYPWYNLDPNDGIIIQQIEWISDLDWQTLQFLYLPIIGSDSYALYHTLYSYVVRGQYRSNELRHADVMNQLVYNKERYIKARQRLEGLGLLRIYTHTQVSNTIQHYYLLRSPIDPDVFFNDGIMSTLLLDYVGEAQFIHLKDYFSQPSLETLGDDWQETTLHFQDVFRLSGNFQQMPSSETTSLLSSNHDETNVRIETTRFDMTYFLELIRDHFIPAEKIDQQVKETTLILSELYGYDEIDLSNLLLEAADIRTQTVDIAKYQRLAFEKSEIKGDNGASLTQRLVISSDQDSQREDKKFWLEQGLTEEEYELTAMVSEYPPADYARSIKKQKGGYLTKSEAIILQDIIERGLISAPVLNIMTHYYLVEREEVTLKRAVMEKTENDWGQHHITTPQAAILHIQGRLKEQAEAKIKRYQNQQKQSRRKWGRNQYQETVPEWFKSKNNDKSDNKIEKNQSKTQYSEEEIQARIASLYEKGEEDKG